MATALETKVNNLLAQWVNGVSSQFMASLIPLALIAFTVYITLLGWQIMRGEAHDPVHLIVKRLLMLAVIGALALGALGYYQTYVINLTQWATQGMVQEIAAGGVSMTALDANGGPINFGNNGNVITIGNLIDAIITTYTNLYNALQSHFISGFVPQFATILAAFFVALALFFVVIVATGFYLLARVELSLCLAVGPLFILLAAFEQTREWTKRWIGQLWQYCVQVALMAACISMLQGMLIFFAIKANQNYASNGGASVFGDVLALFLLSLCVCVIVWNVGALSQALTGAIGGVGHSQARGGSQSTALLPTNATLWGLRKTGQAITGGARGALGWGRTQWGPQNTMEGAAAAGSVPAAQRAAMDNLSAEV
jgi:type IV secretion system protein VirB6